MKFRIGVLALQGGFAEHEAHLASLGAETFQIRKKEDLEKECHGIILPGGESTVIGRILEDLGMLNLLQEKIKKGLPVFGTCAGLILLAKELSNDRKRYLTTLPVKVRRNAYGRQLGSFQQTQNLEGIGEVPLVFIRAPYIEEVEPGVKILAKVEEQIVGVEYQNQLAISFHPELTKCTKVHGYFLEKIVRPYVDGGMV